MNKKKIVEPLTLLEINGITRYLDKVIRNLDDKVDKTQIKSLENQINNF